MLTEAEKLASRNYKKRRKSIWEQTTVWLPIGMKPHFHQLAKDAREQSKTNPEVAQ